MCGLGLHPCAFLCVEDGPSGPYWTLLHRRPDAALKQYKRRSGVRKGSLVCSNSVYNQRARFCEVAGHREGLVANHTRGLGLEGGTELRGPVHHPED